MAKRKPPTLFKRGDTFWLRYTDANGKQQRASLRTGVEEKADRLRAEAELDWKWSPEKLTDDGLAKEPAAAKAGHVMTYSEFVGPYLRWFEGDYPSSFHRVNGIIRGKTRETAELPPNSLAAWFGHMPLNDILPMKVEEWKAARRGDMSQRPNSVGERTTIKKSAVNKEFRQLKAFLAKAVEWYDSTGLKEHPLKRGDKMVVKALKETDSKPPSYFDDDQLKDLYSVSGERRWWWQLYVGTGMRKAEGLHLRADDIRERKVYILSQDESDNDEGGRTKSGLYRTVKLTPIAEDALNHLGRVGFVLPRCHSNSFTRWFAQDVKAANERRVAAGKQPMTGSLHTLRHTFCTHCAMAGIPVTTIQAYAGHSKIETTQRYMHAAPGVHDNLLMGLKFGTGGRHLKVVK